MDYATSNKTAKVNIIDMQRYSQYIRFTKTVGVYNIFFLEKI